MSSASSSTSARTRLADTDAVFRALAHPSRRQILLVLRFRGGEMNAGEIANRFSCRWPTTTRHLRELQKAGLLTVERRGRERFYRLNARRLRSVTGDWLAWFEAPSESKQKRN
jgi:DNA-binding transcriptional ArsR family regulator